MGIFSDEKLKQKVSTLERSNEKLIKEVAALKQQVVESGKRSPEYEKEAKEASRKASEFRNRASDTLDEVRKLHQTVVDEKNALTKIKLDFISLKESTNEDLLELQNNLTTIEESSNAITLNIENTKSKIEEFEKIFNNYTDLNSTLEELQNFENQVEENYNKTTQLLKNITSRKGDIDKLYFEIIGFEQTNEDGEKTNIPGLKSELENTYNNLKDRSVNLSKQISDTIDNAKSKNESLTKEWEDKFSETQKKIQSLLPNALTAGLSHAFSKKKEDEDNSYKQHKYSFIYGIIGLIAVSSIPFFISYSFIKDGKNWEYVIERIPRIVLAIIPIYLPVLWLAFSSSKKMNLSKRLIEEYTHKEVLSKTFEGLSSQIQSISDENISKDLRIKLLQNFMEVYSENPGKLISNYETSDHPIMEVLDQSYKLDSAVEKLKKIPGLDKISKALEDKSEKILKESSQIVDSGLEAMKKVTSENRGES